MAYKPSVLAVADGGTGAATLTGILTGNGTSAVTVSTVTQHGLLVGGASNAVSSTAVGSTGQVLQANSSADPTYSTATYPSTATGTGTLLRANGTNWVATTATSPTTAGAANNVLTSDGTNFNSSGPPGGLLTVTGSLTNTQIKALHGTPIQVIAAPGAGSVISLQQFQIKMIYGGTNVFTAGAAQTINLYYATTTSVGVGLTNAQIVAAATQFSDITVNTQNASNATFDNVAINLFNPVATEISGNAANNNTITWRIVYCIVTI